jgi:hypothetical protein
VQEFLHLRRFPGSISDMTAQAGVRDRTLARRAGFGFRVVALATLGFTVPVFLGPVALRHLHPDPMEWEPSDMEVRQALDGLPFAVRYRVTDVEGGLRWYRGRAVRRGVPVRFAFLIGSGAGERVSPPERFRLLRGCSDLCQEAPSFRVVYASDADLLNGETPAERLMRNTAYDTSFAIVGAVTANRD